MLENRRISVAYIQAFIDSAFVDWLEFCWFSLSLILGHEFSPGQLHKTCLTPLGWKVSQGISFHREKQARKGTSPLLAYSKPHFNSHFLSSHQISHTAKANSKGEGIVLFPQRSGKRNEYFSTIIQFTIEAKDPSCIWIFFKEIN